MDKTDFLLSRSKVAIIGLGLMGGSLALALRGKSAALFGIDPHQATLELARRQSIVDLADSDPAQLLPMADIVILAAPVPGILTLLEQLPSFTPNPCIVLDLGSTKRLIVEAMSHLPERFDPIGGHPICGKEQLSRRYPPEAVKIKIEEEPGIDPALRARCSTAYRLGMFVLIGLAVLTAIAFFVAVTLHSVVHLFIIALIKAGLILQYLMHVTRVWSEEAH